MGWQAFQSNIALDLLLNRDVSLFERLYLFRWQTMPKGNRRSVEYRNSNIFFCTAARNIPSMRTVFIPILNRFSIIEPN